MTHRLIFFIAAGIVLLSACSRTSGLEQYRAEKHVRDSIRLEEQTKSIDFYRQQLELLLPQADSLLTFFTYEKNDKYQDHGFYVAKNTDLRVMVRDDGQDLLVYKDGRRQTLTQPLPYKGRNKLAVERAEELLITIRDIHELEKRIERTSMEIQKYEKRLQRK